jgi:hypothetical protein
MDIFGFTVLAKTILKYWDSPVTFFSQWIIITSKGQYHKQVHQNNVLGKMVHLFSGPPANRYIYFLAKWNQLNNGVTEKKVAWMLIKYVTWRINRMLFFSKLTVCRMQNWLDRLTLFRGHNIFILGMGHLIDTCLTLSCLAYKIMPLFWTGLQWKLIL